MQLVESEVCSETLTLLKLARSFAVTAHCSIYYPSCTSLHGSLGCFAAVFLIFHILSALLLFLAGFHQHTDFKLALGSLKVHREHGTRAALLLESRWNGVY